MKNLYILIIFSCCTISALGQYKVRLAKHATIGVNPNIESYFFVEKLAVESIGNYVFDIKGIDYSHQPIVYFGFKHFRRYQNDPTIIRAAEILKQIRDSLGDNGPILNYLLNQKEFPAKGPRFASDKNTSAADKLTTLLPELTDSLRKFYIKADVAGFLKKNSSFYKGALEEIAKDINRSAYPSIEKWYGKKFPRYELYISPAMPITPGEDSYRGFGPVILSPDGKIPSMVVSSSKMLKLQDSLPLYRQYGFDNRGVTQFITVHEISHSFVNPLLERYEKQIKADSALFIKELKDTLASRGIRDWYVCVIEHLVRLGEIRIAVSNGNIKEADRLRDLHIGEYSCVLIPLLEEKITEYEKNRAKYPTFESYLPELIGFLHNLTPKTIKDQFLKYDNHKIIRG
ncbi:DUF4932 domain-containing protein [Pedobacter jeongneungensis]|uniref:DUF4932 domain-containing protein n=1 Tax=Pedobacter jeongneungensis TaxID=947309 RepID=UPI000468EABE|nr:DUF4932 domain-containing protein [Pedobacter jeongneungensis]